MKKLFINLLFAMIATAFTIGNSNASGNEITLILNISDKKQVDLHLNDISGKIKLYLLDNSGSIHFERKVRVKQNMKLKLDLSNIAIGDYSLIIREKNHQRTVPVKVLEQNVQLATDQLYKTFFPRVKVEKDLVTVKMLSDTSNDLYITIYSTSGNLLFEEKLDGRLGLISKRFKFQSGMYKMSLSSKSYSDIHYLSF